jgi:hypothetical protein
MKKNEKGDMLQLLSKIEKRLAKLEKITPVVGVGVVGKGTNPIQELIDYQPAPVDKLAEGLGKSVDEAREELERLAEGGKALSLAILGQPRLWLWRYEPEGENGTDRLFPWLQGLLEAVHPRSVSHAELKLLSGADEAKLHSALNRLEYNSLVSVDKASPSKKSYTWDPHGQARGPKKDSPLRAARRRRGNVSRVKSGPTSPGRRR